MNQEVADGLRTMMPQINATRPSVGKRVRVEEGRRSGAEGTVLRHIRDRYNTMAFRYGSDANQHLRDLMGRYGFRVQIESETHGLFWINAEKVTVLG